MNITLIGSYARLERHQTLHGAIARPYQSAPMCVLRILHHSIYSSRLAPHQIYTEFILLAFLQISIMIFSMFFSSAPYIDLERKVNCLGILVTKVLSMAVEDCLFLSIHVDAAPQAHRPTSDVAMVRHFCAYSKMIHPLSR